MANSNGPGLARAGTLPFYVQKTLYRGQDARWSEAFAKADLVSEGAVSKSTASHDPNGATASTYFGSTSILLQIPPREQARAVHLARECVHVRLRAIRLARREAEVRSSGPLGVSRCFMKIVEDPCGLRIDVDLEAPLLRKSGIKPNAASAPKRDAR